ncbi:MAG: aminoglycoside phosphotransferase family protein [archaeon]
MENHEERINEIVRKEFDADVLSIKRITEGYSHFMYDIEINKFPFIIIIRFSNSINKRFNLAKEKYVIEILQSNNIPSPKIYAFHYPQENEKEGYMILGKFKGQRLDTIWDFLSKEEKIKITKELGKLLSEIHKIKLPKYGFVGEYGNIITEMSEDLFEFRSQGEKTEHSQFLKEFLAEILKDLARVMAFKTVSPEFIKDFMHYLAKNLDKIDSCQEPTLIHGDFMTGHIFVDKIEGEYKIQGLIDFEFALSLSPDYDFIKLHRQGFFEDEELKNALKESYGEINEEAVKVHRIIRDLQFAIVLLESGNKELHEEKISEIWEKIKSELS